MATIGKWQPRFKTEIVKRQEESRDSQPMRVACCVPGCKWKGYLGPAGTARERARDHRRKCHPDRPLIARKPKKPKVKKPEQTAEDRKILKALAERQNGKKAPKVVKPAPKANGRPSIIDTLDIEEIRRLYTQERLSQTEIGKRLGVSQYVISQAMMRFQIPVQRRSKITPERMEAAWRLYEAGLTSTQIGGLAYELWGYKTPESCRTHVIRSFRAVGREIRLNTQSSRLAWMDIPDVNREQALAILEEAG